MRKIFKITGIVLGILLILALSMGSNIYFKIRRIKNTIHAATLLNKKFHTVIPFIYNGLVTIKVQINGSPVLLDFIFDTGATTAISYSLFKTLDENDYEIISANTNSHEVAVKEFIVKIKKLQIGDLVFKDVGAIVIDNSKMGQLNCISPNGIIGCNILKKCICQLNYSKQELVITDDLRTLSGYEKQTFFPYNAEAQGTPVIEAIIDDSVVCHLIFDTGCNGVIRLSSGELLNKYLYFFGNRTMKFYSNPSLTIEGEKPNSYFEVDYLCKIKSLSMMHHKYNNLIIELNDKLRRHADGLIGNEFLKNFITTINFPERMISLQPIDSIVFPDTVSDIYAIQISSNNKEVFISSANEWISRTKLTPLSEV